MVSWYGIFLPEQNPLYPLDESLVGSQNQSAECGLKKLFLPVPGIKPSSLDAIPIAIHPRVVIISMNVIEGDAVSS
jgi:hypothetical protein